ncbi:hypothetical protein RN001_009035 [Aquatica leii]|uniref:Uncharacterized protein n=1 Tax=Aquatica leii TaxID=1421715 RepID=A0AAN7PTC2_9COLE|nr:hypothetical protein RN001_009035 [Aquatica leii]
MFKYFVLPLFFAACVSAGYLGAAPAVAYSAPIAHAAYAAPIAHAAYAAPIAHAAYSAPIAHAAYAAPVAHAAYAAPIAHAAYAAPVAHAAYAAPLAHATSYQNTVKISHPVAVKAVAHAAYAAPLAHAAYAAPLAHAAYAAPAYSYAAAAPIVKAAPVVAAAPAISYAAPAYGLNYGHSLGYGYGAGLYKSCIKDIMKRLDRIRTINNIMQDLKEVIVFPREEKKRMKRMLNPTLDLKEFSDAMINEAVENALEDVLKSTRELDIIVDDLSACYTAIPLIQSSEDEKDVLIDDKMIDTSNGNSIDANRLQNFTSLPIEETDDNNLIDANSDMRKNLSDISSAGIIDDLIMRSYDDKMADEIIEEDPYVRVTVGNKSKVIKKSSLCWLLEETKNRISTDRLKRFLPKSTEKPENDKVLAETQQKIPQKNIKV